MKVVLTTILVTSLSGHIHDSSVCVCVCVCGCRQDTAYCGLKNWHVLPLAESEWYN